MSQLIEQEAPEAEYSSSSPLPEVSGKLFRFYYVNNLAIAIQLLTFFFFSFEEIGKVILRSVSDVKNIFMKIPLDVLT